MVKGVNWSVDNERACRDIAYGSRTMILTLKDAKRPAHSRVARADLCEIQIAQSSDLQRLSRQLHYLSWPRVVLVTKITLEIVPSARPLMPIRLAEGDCRRRRGRPEMIGGIQTHVMYSFVGRID